jgi:hypothetical protein
MTHYKLFLMSAVVLGAITPLTRPAAHAETPTSPGVYVSREEGASLAPQREGQIVESLRRITGVEDLGFAADGSLRVGASDKAKAGSETARSVLRRAAGSRLVFVIEDHSGSPSVNFGQIDEGMNYEDLRRPGRVTIHRVRLDFSDFAEMQASRAVRASFDVGFTLLHELLHGLGYEDTTEPGEVGGCEEVVNRARAELGLPLRDHYLGELTALTLRRVSTVRLRFKSRAVQAGRPRWRWHYLYFLKHHEPSDGAPCAAVRVGAAR